MFAFRIKRDHLAERYPEFDGRQGQKFGDLAAFLEYDPITMKLYDDDGELYYTVDYYGVQDERMFAPQDWAGDDAGVTTTKIKEGDEWVIL